MLGNFIGEEEQRLILAILAVWSIVPNKFSIKYNIGINESYHAWQLNQTAPIYDSLDYANCDTTIITRYTISRNSLF